MTIIISHDVDHLYAKEHWFRDFIYPKLWIRESLNLIRKNISLREWILRLTDCFRVERNNIEALATGTPVIATACGGPSDIVTEKNGMLVTIDDTEELATAMKKMMLSSAKYDHAKIAASASELYFAKAVAAQLGDYFSTVLG